MRRRSTFIHDPQLDINPSQLQLFSSRFVIKDLQSAREERLTFSFSELPQELWQVLKQTHELHIRWSSDISFQATAPFVSRISPGLHVYFTPLRNQASINLCPLLHKVFSEELKCDTTDATFTSPSLVSSRFASTSSLQYHSVLPNLNNLVIYMQRTVCPHSDQACIHAASLLRIADTIDLDYDSISHALTFTAHWSKAPSVYFDPLTQFTTYNSWSLTVSASPHPNDKVEIGILTPAAAPDAHDIQLSGVLSVPGEDDHPNPTLFDFPSRHHPISLASPPSQKQTYTVSFQQPTGLHPTLLIDFPASTHLIPPGSKPSDSTCALHTYLTLPSSLFADQYQLGTTDVLFLSSHHLVALRAISGATDLEAPDYAVAQWGSNVLLQLAVPPPAGTGQPWQVSIPLHTRYLAPAAGGTTPIAVPWPVVFWACTAEDGTKFPVNPFDRVSLGYDGLFGERTMFYHLEPAPANRTVAAAGVVVGGVDAWSARLVETIRVPVLDTDAVGARFVEPATVLCILLGWAWVSWSVLRAWRRGRSAASPAVKLKETKKKQ